MSVNVSAYELAHRHLLYHVAAALAKAQAPAEALCIEVTEQVALEQPEEVIRELQALRALGVRIALDDFGTGFSSLVHLRRLPVDELKIDASFVQGAVREPSAAAIVTAVTGLARDLRLAVVAGGVETDDQLEAVVERGCGVVQLLSAALQSADCPLSILRLMCRVHRFGPDRNPWLLEVPCSQNVAIPSAGLRRNRIAFRQRR